MPTYADPRADAAETSEALRALAYTTRILPDPADSYPVIGDLLASVRSLQQILDQLATAHLSHHARAHDDNGDQAAGVRSARAAAEQLHQAATLLGQVESHLDAASQHSGRIAWHPAEPERRWVSIVFLQHQEADQVLNILHRRGARAAIEHLAQWDHGEESVQAAMINGYVYNVPPTGPLERTATRGSYTLTYNPFLGHIGLLRELPVGPEPEPQLEPHSGRRAIAASHLRPHPGPDTNRPEPFAAAKYPSCTSSARRGLSL